MRRASQQRQPPTRTLPGSRPPRRAVEGRPIDAAGVQSQKPDLYAPITLPPGNTQV